MKDRYLFKAKRADNGKWVTGFLMIAEYEEFREQAWIRIWKEKKRCWGDHPEVIPKTICACTGLKNKNGELIFEGDKVRYETGQPDRPHIEEEVYWGDGAFYPVCTMPSSEFEIIGNIHDKE